jgi:hypothetical protein
MVVTSTRLREFVEGFAGCTGDDLNKTDTTSSFVRVIKWLRAQDEISSIKTTRKIIAIFLACVLSLTLIGIVPVALSVIEWKKQQRASEKVYGQRPSVHDQPVTNTGNPKSQPAVGKADLRIEHLDRYRFSDVPDELVLAKQEQIIPVHSRHGRISLDELKRNGLLPIHHIVLGEVSIYCSNVFKLENHYVAIALVQINDKLYPRLIYHSNSQGTWRVIPDAVKMSGEQFGERQIVHFGKGQCESDTQLSIPLICALNNLSYSTAEETQYNAGNIVETCVFGEPPRFNQEAQAIPSMFLQETAPKWFYNTGMIVPRTPNPKDIRMPINGDLHPDFSEILANFQQTIPHYGEVFIKIFASKDKNILYMFYEMRDGRAFLAATECIHEAGITSFGVREKFAETNNMDAPLLEYSSQIPRGFEPEHPFENRYDSGFYQSNWNFVRELEIIQRYYSEQGKPLPEKV